MTKPQKKILLVDDDPISLRTITAYLNAAGYTCVSVENGQLALAELIRAPNDFGLVIADRVMPYLHGTELAEQMQENPQLKNIPLILVTGVADKEEVIAGIKAGARDFLYKPIEKELLLAIVKKYFHYFK